MSKFGNALRFIGDVAETMAERDAAVKKLTKEILSKTYGVEYDQAEKIARVLLDRAEPITWK